MTLYQNYDPYANQSNGAAGAATGAGIESQNTQQKPFDGSWASVLPHIAGYTLGNRSRTPSLPYVNPGQRPSPQPSPYMNPGQRPTHGSYDPFSRWQGAMDQRAQVAMKSVPLASPSNQTLSVSSNATSGGENEPPPVGGTPPPGGTAPPPGGTSRVHATNPEGSAAPTSHATDQYGDYQYDPSTNTKYYTNGWVYDTQAQKWTTGGPPTGGTRGRAAVKDAVTQYDKEDENGKYYLEGYYKHYEDGSIYNGGNGSWITHTKPAADPNDPYANMAPGSLGGNAGGNRQYAEAQAQAAKNAPAPAPAPGAGAPGTGSSDPYAGMNPQQRALKELQDSMRTRASYDLSQGERALRARAALTGAQNSSGFMNSVGNYYADATSGLNQALSGLDYDSWKTEAKNTLDKYLGDLGAKTSLGVARIGAHATEGAASASAGASMYGADQSRIASMYGDNARYGMAQMDDATRRALGLGALDVNREGNYQSWMNEQQRIQQAWVELMGRYSASGVLNGIPMPTGNIITNYNQNP